VAPVLWGSANDVGVLGAGCAFPAAELTNADVLRAIAPFTWPGRALDDEAIAFMAAGLAESMGVQRRAWAHRVGLPLDHATEPTTLDLAIAAGRRALEDAGVGAESLALVIVATSTPHRMTSTLSAQVGSALGASAACMDVRSGCSGGLFALSTAALHVAAGAGPALVIGTETFSKIIPPASKVAAMSLGDGAGALVVGKLPGAVVESVSLETDGRLGRLISTDGALPPTEAEIARGGYVLSGAPDELTAVVPEKYTIAIDAALGRAAMRAGAIDLFVPHQTSAALVRSVAARAGIAPERTVVNVARHANVGAAGWLVAFAEARAEGRAPRGARVLVAAVGGGMSWGAAILRC
jgi:3-oxoacyl-[acyl-carrier-protein] synthase-3